MSTNDGSDRRSIFVTVGTTLFDSLIEAVSSCEFLALISRPKFGGYTEITIQYGKGRRPQVAGDEEDDDGDGAFDRMVKIRSDDVVDDNLAQRRNVRVRGYRFKPSLESDFRSADLVISHAGAGSIMEGVAACSEDQAMTGAKDDERSDKRKAGKRKKKLAVVINSILMDDHQTELAEAMGTRGYLHVVPDPSLLSRGDGHVMREIEEFDPKPFPGGNDGEFAAMLDEHMGFAVSEETEAYAETSSADEKKRL